MILDIKPYRNDSYNCWQITIATLAKYMNIDYEMQGIGRIDFKYQYNNEKNIIGDGIQPYSKRSSDGINKFHGLIFDTYCTKDTVTKELIIDALNREIPLIEWGDLYYCNWNVAYKKHHYVHSFIVAGYNEEIDKFVCIDSYITEKRIECTYEELTEGATLFDQIRYVEKEVNPDLYKSELKEDIIYYRERNIYETISQFVNDIEKKMDLEREVTGYGHDFYAVPLFDNLQIISSSRKCYSEMLQYVSKKHDIRFENLAIKMLQCADKWMNVRTSLIKLSMTKRNIESNIEKIANKIREINLCEKEVMDFMYNIVS